MEDCVRILSFFLVFMLACCHAFADQVTLKNGDRLSGEILKSDEKSLVLKTEFAGEVKIDWSAVTNVESSQDMTVGLKEGKTVSGTVNTTGENVVITPKSGQPVEVPKSAVVVMRNPAEQTAYHKSVYPGLMEGWKGGLNVGFALTRGNSETKNLNLAFNAVRTGHRDKLTLYANSIYATNDAEAASPHTTANNIGGGARYDRDITSRIFGFGNTDFYADDLQGLDLRFVFGGGLGFHAIKGEKTTLDLLGGANYTHESYTTETRDFAALQFGDEFMHTIGAGTVLKQNLYFFPDMKETGEYRMTFTFGTVTKISKWLGWQNSFGDIYVSNPAPIPGRDVKKNDIVLTTGLNFTFTR
jgi:putative salt-induced outer membrane protein YdiY